MIMIIKFHCLVQTCASIQQGIGKPVINALHFLSALKKGREGYHPLPSLSKPKRRKEGRLKAKSPSILTKVKKKKNIIIYIEEIWGVSTIETVFLLLFFHTYAYTEVLREPERERKRER